MTGMAGTAGMVLPMVNIEPRGQNMQCAPQCMSIDSGRAAPPPSTAVSFDKNTTAVVRPALPASINTSRAERAITATFIIFALSSACSCFRFDSASISAWSFARPWIWS